MTEFKDGSSVEVDRFGVKSYFDKRGKLHREDGPAIEYPDGYKAWYKHGLWHREDGPAVEYPSGHVIYCLNGVNYETKEDFEQALNPKELY